MAFEKGQSGNPSGRKPGTPNNVTATAREAISAALDKADAGRLAAVLDTLTGKEYIDAYVKLAEFVAPKLSRAAIEVSTPAPQHDLSALTDEELDQLETLTRKTYFIPER